MGVQFVRIEGNEKEPVPEIVAVTKCNQDMERADDTPKEVYLGLKTEYGTSLDGKSTGW